jgi:hypothetical protein
MQRTTFTNGRLHDIARRAPAAEGLVAGERVPHRGVPVTAVSVSQRKYNPDSRTGEG